MKLLQLSTDADCLRERDIPELKGRQKYYGTVTGEGKRELSLTGIKGSDGTYWADRVTGQLYSKDDGHCLSSPNLWLEIWTVKASRAREAE